MTKVRMKFLYLARSMPIQSHGISQDIIDRMLWHIDIIDRIIVLEAAGISLALGEGWSAPFHSLDELPKFKRAQQRKPKCRF